MRRAITPLLAAGLSTIAVPALADEVEATRGSPLRIDRPQLEVRLADGVIQATVRYDVVNPSAAPDAATIEVALPAGTAVTGLRYRTGDRWRDGALRDAVAASTRYREYLDAPFVAARGAAFFSHDGYRAELALSYLPPRGRVAVAYDLTVPACYARGRWIAVLPLVEPAPAVHVTGGRVETEAALAAALGQPVGDACAGFTSVDSDRLDEERYLVFPRPAASTSTSTLTTVDAVGTRVSELVVALAPRLQAAPGRAAVVFTVDASRSVWPDDLAAQLAVVRAYVAEVPDARVEIIVVRRYATRLFGALVPAGQVEARLAALAPGALALGNGSNLDAGLALAADVLAHASGPRRLVAFTDDRTRAALDDQTLIAALAPLPADAIVHLVMPHAGGVTQLTRDFEHRFGAVAARWGGIVAAVEVGPEPGSVTELVRPIRVERVTVVAPNGSTEEVGAIDEGTGLRRLFAGATAPTVTGWIWGRPWAPTATTTRADRVRVARLAVGAIGASLDDAAVVALARMGTVATRLTSFLAEDSAWRPGGLPAEDLDQLGIAGFSSSSRCGWPSPMMGTGHVGTLGHGAGGGSGRVDPVPELGPLIEARVAACAAPLAALPWSTALAVEVTGVEIVDVTLTTDAPTATAAQRAQFDACVVESAWDLELDARFARYGDRSFEARFTR